LSHNNISKVSMFFNKICSVLFFFIISPIFSMQQEDIFPLQELPDDLVPVVMINSNNVITINVLIRTCKRCNNLLLLSDNRLSGDSRLSIDDVLFRADPRVWVPKLTSQQHTNLLIRYAQRDDINSFSQIMASESNIQKNKRLNNLIFFNYDETPHFESNLSDCIKCSLSVYKGISHNHKISENYFYNDYYKAIRTGQHRIIDILLKNKINLESLNQQGYGGETYLMLAVLENNKVIIELFLKNGSCVDSQEKVYGNTALHLACLYNFSSIVKLLLEYKADYTIRNSRGYTPLDF